jgi:hypothetical protein
MRRREFIAGFGGAAVWPMATWAQLGQLVRRIGALIGASESDLGRQTWVAEFRKALQELGWTEGRNIQIDWRWAAGNRGLAKTYAAELVTLRPDVLFGDNTFVVEGCARGQGLTLPPGRLRLATRPVLIGSALVANMIGIVEDTDLAASAAAGTPFAKITSTWRPTSSVASAHNRSFRVSAQRYTISTFRPST